jgi:UV DNA damage repair endonuclease
MTRWMGYGKTFQDMKINVHIAGKRGPNGFLEAYERLSEVAKNCITIENEEMTHGLDACLSISDRIPVVLDIHHHFIKTGEYITPDDPRVEQVIQSWRGVRPTLHYSISREDVLANHCASTKPDLNLLLETGHSKQKLRAHSNFYWNDAVNDWALSHWVWADILCESKAKNLASFSLYEHAKKAMSSVS